MDNVATADDVIVALRPYAVTAVRQAQADRPDNFRLWAVKLLRDATNCHLGDGARAVDWATAHLAATRLNLYLLPRTYGDPWAYEFPNGHEATVINDPHRPFRFEVLSDDPADAARGRVAPGLTSEQVEAKLHVIAALPAI